MVFRLGRPAEPQVQHLRYVADFPLPLAIVFDLPKQRARHFGVFEYGRGRVLRCGPGPRGADLDALHRELVEVAQPLPVTLSQETMSRYLCTLIVSTSSGIQTQDL